MMILSRKSNFICCIFSLFLLLTACNNGTTEKNYPGIDESEYDAKTRTLKDLRDNQVYKTTTIGTQIWMAQNLNFNTADGFCYYETPENCKIYGSLYIWSAAMDSAGVFSNNSKKCGYGKLCSAKEPIRGICPKGWHLPSKAEFNILIEATGGDNVAGKVLKSSTGWESGNGTDDFGFSAQASGERYYKGDFSNLGKCSSLWSTTEENDTFVYDMYLSYDYDSAILTSLSKYSAQSIRCIKD